MNDNENVRSNLAGTVTVVLLSFLLFYFPSVLAIFGSGGEPKEWTLLSVGMATVYTAVFCLNYFWIVPATLFRNDRKYLFFLFNFILILCACSMIPIWFETHGGLPQPGHKRLIDVSISEYLMGYLRFVIRDSITMVLAAALAYALRLSQEREEMRRRELELNAERKQIELKSLKAQLNPHFLFNSLNNIYALIAISTERAQKAIHDLSGMLRFMIYDAASSSVPLEKEIRFIEDYIELMRLRVGSGIMLTCDLNCENSNSIHIAPLIFLTIIENAFKHVSGNGKEKFISISLFTDNDNLTCEVTNSYNENEHRQSLSAAESGVGLVNVERQLGLLYPGAYTMTHSGNDGIYHASISISLSALKMQDKVESDVMTLES